MKNIIKRLVRESLTLEDKGGNKEKGDDKKSSKNGGKEKNTKMDYADVQNALDKDRNPTAPSHVGVMKSLGIEDDDAGVNRSLFGKKLHQEKNSDGGLYQFDENTIAKIRAIVGLA